MLDIQTLWLWLAIARMQKNVSWCMNCVTMGTSQSGYLVCFHFHSRTIFSTIFINGIPNWKLITGKDKSLPWIQRLEIAIDSARGLWFLHTFPEGCIVHRDVKVDLFYIPASSSVFLPYTLFFKKFFLLLAANKHTHQCQLSSKTVRLWVI